MCVSLSVLVYLVGKCNCHRFPEMEASVVCWLGSSCCCCWWLNWLPLCLLRCWPKTRSSPPMRTTSSNSNMNINCSCNSNSSNANYRRQQVSAKVQFLECVGCSSLRACVCGCLHQANVKGHLKISCLKNGQNPSARGVVSELGVGTVKPVGGFGWLTLSRGSSEFWVYKDRINDVHGNFQKIGIFV